MRLHVLRSVFQKPDHDMTDKEKELASLDTNLQLIIVDSLDDEMTHQVMNCKHAKHMCDTISMIMEGIEKVRKNRLDILTSQYEVFKSLPGRERHSSIRKV